MNSKIKRLEKHLSANATGVELRTWSTGKRVVITSRAKLAAYLRRFHRQIPTGGAS